MSNELIVHLETITITDEANALCGYQFYMDKITGEMFCSVASYTRTFSSRAQKNITIHLQKIRKKEQGNSLIVEMPLIKKDSTILFKGGTVTPNLKAEMLSTKGFKGGTVTPNLKAEINTAKIILKNRKFTIQTKGGLQEINPITEKEFCQLIIEDNPELASMIMQAGVRLFHHELIKYNHAGTKISRKYSECDLQNLLIFLSAHTNKNIKVEQAVAFKHSYRRFDVVDLSCPSIHRIIELKKGRLTKQHIEQKIRLFSADGNYVASYLEAACNKYQDTKIIELIFVSNDGLSSSAEALLFEYVDSKGFIKYQYLPFLLSPKNINRRVKIKYQSFDNLTQPLIDKIYEEYYKEGGLKAISHFEEMVNKFMLGDVAIKPTKDYKFLT